MAASARGSASAARRTPFELGELVAGIEQRRWPIRLRPFGAASCVPCSLGILQDSTGHLGQPHERLTESDRRLLPSRPGRVSSPGQAAPAAHQAAPTTRRCLRPRRIAAPCAASRSSADWKTVLWVSTAVFPRSVKVTVSGQKRPGMPSNSSVWTMPSSDGVPYKTPRNAYSLPAFSKLMYRQVRPWRG